VADAAVATALQIIKLAAAFEVLTIATTADVISATHVVEMVDNITLTDGRCLCLFSIRSARAEVRLDDADVGVTVGRDLKDRLLAPNHRVAENSAIIYKQPPPTREILKQFFGGRNADDSQESTPHSQAISPPRTLEGEGARSVSLNDVPVEAFWGGVSELRALERLSVARVEAPKRHACDLKKREGIPSLQQPAEASHLEDGGVQIGPGCADEVGPGELLDPSRVEEEEKSEGSEFEFDEGADGVADGRAATASADVHDLAAWDERAMRRIDAVLAQRSEVSQRRERLFARAVEISKRVCGAETADSTPEPRVSN
jgi:hypothetical protein